MGYSTIALSQTSAGKLPPNLKPPTPPSNAPQGLNFLSRLTLTLSDLSQNQRLASLAQSYDLVALRPTNEKALLNACTSLECDLISLDLSVRLPYHFKFKMFSAAVSRGVRVEICYGAGVTGSGVDARRNLIGNAMALIRATRGRGVVVSSEAKRALNVRAPWDVINLACVWGLSQERGKEAVCEEARKVVALARLKRSSWRGIVDIVDGGQQETGEATPGKAKADKKAEKKSEGQKNAEIPQGSGLKRKVEEANVEGAEKPLSKREMKRRAKKARLQAAGDQNGDAS